MKRLSDAGVTLACFMALEEKSCVQKEGWRLNPQPSIKLNFLSPCLLRGTDPKHLGSAGWTYTLGRRLAVLHRYGFGIFHYLLGTTFYAICFH